MKKFLALALVGTMLVSVPVFAAEKTAGDVVLSAEEDGNEVSDDGGNLDDSGENEEEEGDEETGSPSPKPPVKPSPKPLPAPMECGQAVEAPSVTSAIEEAAAAQGKTVGEYLNNAVTTVPGLENVMPVGQGGHVIINGAPSNQVFSVLKPTREDVSSAKLFAASLNGRVLNVVRIKASINGFRTAEVNFYMKGVTAGQNIKVFQIVNGRWLEVDVLEIREDHVVVEMTSLGTLAFLEMPSK